MPQKTILKQIALCGIVTCNLIVEFRSLLRFPALAYLLERVEIKRNVILSSDVGAKKPGEKIFRYAFEKFGISPEDSIYVGNDLSDDILGASSVGMRTAYIRTEQSGSYTDPLPKPTFLATTHKELMQTLFSLAK